MRKILKYWFVVVFALTLFYPFFGKAIEDKINLSGVTSSGETVERSWETLKTGEYQTYLGDKWEKNFPGRKILLKTRNQILYSVLGVSPNKNVIVGKEGYLYEPAYIYRETQAYDPATEEYFETLGKNLAALQEQLAKNGKELYVFITPSKAHFYDEYFPDRYDYLNRKDMFSYTEYSKLIEILDENEIIYFDSIQYIEENIEHSEIQAPLFYKSGIHWSRTWGYHCAVEFLNVMDEESKYELAELVVSESQNPKPIYPDTDLYGSLNLWTTAQDTWYKAAINTVEEGEDHPNVFFRGGSFMGQSLFGLVSAGVFGEDVHFENNYYHMNRYSNSKNLSGFSAYDEMDMDTLLGKSDILILEVNEAVISKMSWGFIEYLLEHPEYLDYNY